MAFFRKAYDDTRTFQKIVIVLIVICILVGIACIMFYNQVGQTVQDEGEHYLREISNRISSNVERTINDNFAALETMRYVLESDQEKSFSQVGDFLQEQEKHWKFYKSLLIDDTGVAYDNEGKEVSITGDSFLRRLSSDKVIIEPAQIINNEEMFTFATPLDILLEGNKIVALAICYEPEKMDELLSMTSFNEQAYSYIVNKQGKAITRSSSSDDNPFGYNILHTIANNEKNDQESALTLETDLLNEKANQYKVYINNTEEYLIYTPIVGVTGWDLFTFVPVAVVSAKSDMLLRNTLGMTGLIFLVFFLFLVIIIFTFTRNKKRLEHIAYVDNLTKGNTLQRFQEYVSEELDKTDATYAMLFTNIQKFKLLNDQFGRQTCDQIIISIHQGISNLLHEGEYIGHHAADNFIILVQFDTKEELEKRLYDWHVNMGECALNLMNSFPLFVMEYGIYVLDDIHIPFESMVDRTKMSLRDSIMVHAYNDYIHYAYYDDAARSQMLMEKRLEDMMDDALKNNDFKVYLQPKYVISNNKIGGAEALVRWQSKDEMIFPNTFIPLFERNGFIVKLDLWMFEQVCILLQSWQDEGKELIKISVNCSRAHLKDPDFLEEYKRIFQTYTIPSEYIELEFTETMVYDDTERLVKVIDDIHKLGFGCSMDDFGSGYSSLNLLQDIHVDTLKLDRVFFKNGFKEDPRTKAIISCVLDMAQTLQMSTVAEGIEDWELVDALREMGCDYVQGYVYAKPMPIELFEKLLFSTLSV